MSSNAPSFTPVRKAVIPIAGWGSRMYPASRATPKALMPIVDKDGICKPILQVIIEEALSGLGSDGLICLVVQPGQQQLIESYFSQETVPALLSKTDLAPQINQLTQIGSRISFVTQLKQEGFGHSILCARDWVGNEPFLVMLGDHVYTTQHQHELTCVQQLVQQYKKTGKPATTLGICEEEIVGSNGIVIGDIATSHSDAALSSSTSSASSSSSLPSSFPPSYSTSDSAAGDSVDPVVYRCVSTVEKPSPNYAREHLRVSTVPSGFYLCYFGIDLLTPTVFTHLQRNYDAKKLTKGELQLRDAMGEMMKEDQFDGVRVKGQRHDTGMPNVYAESFAVMYAESIRIKQKQSKG